MRARLNVVSTVMAFVIGSALSGAGAQGGSFSVQLTGPDHVGKGETFAVNVTASGNGVSGIDFLITYDPSLLRGVSAVAGSWLTSQGPVLASPGNQPPDNTNGQVTDAFAIQGSGVANGAGAAAVVSFQALSDGVAVLTLQGTAATPGILVDANGDSIPSANVATQSSLSVPVGSGAPSAASAAPPAPLVVPSTPVIPAASAPSSQAPGVPMANAVVGARGLRPLQVQPGTVVEGSVAVNVASRVVGLGLEEHAPNGWQLTPVDNAGADGFRAAETQWLWKVAPAGNYTVQYEVAVPGNADVGPYAFTGAVSTSASPPTPVVGDGNVTVVVPLVLNAPGNVGLNASFNVTVTQRGQPVGGALVSMNGSSLGPTAPDGSFKVPGSPNPGALQVDASKLYYLNATAEVQVQSASSGGGNAPQAARLVDPNDPRVPSWAKEYVRANDLTDASTGTLVGWWSTDVPMGDHVMSLPDIQRLLLLWAQAKGIA